MGIAPPGETGERQLLAPRTEVAAYAIETLLAEGTTSCVYRVRHVVSQQRYALKIARPHAALVLRRERALLSRLERAAHPGIVQIADHGERQGLPWYVMEELGAGSLRGWQRRLWEGAARLDAADGAHGSRRAAGGQLARVLALVCSIADALGQVHEAGIVHGDVAPGNILFRTADEPVLADFGAALRGPNATRVKVSVPADHPGTPGYAAPERLRGEVFDSRADLYSLGCLWYELVTGRPVFSSDRESGLHRQHRYARPVPPSAYVAGLPEALEQILLSLLAKDPFERCARASDLTRAIASELDSARPRTFRAPLFRPRLIGRERALLAVTTRLADAREGVGGFCLVRAQPGCGLTRFLYEAARVAGELGYRTIHADPRSWAVYEGNRGTEAGALRSLSPVFDELARVLRPQAECVELAPLVPYHHRLAAVLHTTSSGPTRANHEAVFRALLYALCRLGRERPLLLVLDRAEGADELTGGFVAWLLARQPALERVLVLIGMTEEPGASAPGAVIGAGEQVISLLRLSHAECTRMLADMLGVPEISAALADSAFGFARGHPRALSEYACWSARSGLRSDQRPRHFARPRQRGLRHHFAHPRQRGLRHHFARPRQRGLRHHFARPRQRGLRHHFAHPRQRGLRREQARDILAARLAALPASVSQVAAIASLLHGCFSPEELAPLLESASGCGALPEGPAARSGPALESALDLLLRRRFLRRASDGRYYFAHESYRLGLQALLAPERLRTLHAQLAHQLSAFPRPPAPQAEIGHHWACAGRPDLAAAALRRASREAASRLAFDDAVEHLRAAWEVLQTDGNGACAGVRVARLGLELLGLYSRTARHESVWKLGRMLTASSPAGASPLVQSRARRLMALSYRMCGKYELALAELDLAADLLQKAGPRRGAVMREQIEQDVLRARVHYVRGDAQAMWEVVARTLPRARRHGRPTQVATLYMDAANAIVSQRRHAYSRRALRYQRRALALYRALAPRASEGLMAQFDLAYMLLLGGADDWREARALLQDAEQKIPYSGDTALRCRVSLYLAIAQRRLGEQVACRAAAERAFHEARACGFRGYMGAAKACLAWTELVEAREQDQLGRAARVEELAAEARAFWWRGERGHRARLAEYPFQWLAHWPLVHVLADEERYRECVPWLAELLHPAHARLCAPVRRTLATALRMAEDARCDATAFAHAVEACLSSARAAGYL